MTPRLRVALVDDHAVVREGYRRLLETEPDIQVVAEHDSAESLQAALPRLADGTPLVVVLDLSMPGRGGLDLLRHSSLRWPGVVVLVFSMHDHPAMVAQALAAGAAGYITKTTAPARLVEAVRRVAGGDTSVLSDDVAAAPGVPLAQPPHLALTPREFDVLHLLVQGATLDTIATRLRLSPKTVSNLQTSLRSRLGVSTSVELMRYAQQHRLFAG